MGNLIKRKLKMKVALLLVLALAISVNTQSTVNQLQACITEGQLFSEHALNALDGAVNQDQLKVLTEGLAATAEFEKMKTACKAVKTQDAMMWLDQHTTPGQQICISNILGMLMNIPALKAALNNPDLSMQDKMKAFSPIVEATEKIAESCVPAA